MYYAPKLSPPRFYESTGAGSVSQPARNAPVLLRDRKLICSNAVFSVYLDRVEQPDGRQVVDYLSIVPKNRTENNVTGVAVLPEYDGKFGLIQVYRHPLGSVAWELPRGFVDAGESSADAALRELREEMGLETTKASLVCLGMVAPEPGLIAARVQLFAALRCSRVAADQHLELGHTARRFFAAHEIEDLISRNEIQDPCTIVACSRHGRVAVSTSTGK